MKTILFPHQKAAIKKAKTVLGNSKTMRFNMCTGAGKTVTTVHTIESLYGKIDATVLVAAHTTILVEQFKNAVEKERKNNFPNSKLTWKFDTYQSLTKQDKIAKKLILVVDEVHQGGLENTSEKIKSYQKIQKIQKPFKIISLSATDSGVNEKLFGVKKSNTFFYTYNDAMRDNVINDCTITTIHTGLEQYFMDKDSKAEHKKTYNDLESAYEDCLENGVDFSDPETVKSYEEGKIASAISVYFQEWTKVSKKHNVRDMEQAVFYVKTIELAERGVQLFTSYYNHYLNSLSITNYPDAATKVVRAAHSHSEESDKVINDFKNKEFKVLFNVKQIQEGFDYPELSMIFDCAPSFSNNSRIFQQRLGRSLRKHSSKSKPSQYFIVTGLTTAVSPRYSVEKFREAVSSVEGISGIDNDALGAFVQVGSRAKKDISTHFSDKNADESQVELGVNHASLFSLDSKNFGLLDINKKINVQAVTGNLIVTGAYKETKVNQVTLSSILQIKRPEKKKQELYEMALRGEPKPKPNHPLYDVMITYSNTSNDMFDKQWIIKMNSVCDWFVTITDKKEIEYKSFYQKNKRHPTNLDNFRLRQWANRHATKDSLFKQFLIQTNFYPKDTLLEDYIKFVSKNKRQPSLSIKNERLLYTRVMKKRRIDSNFKQATDKKGFAQVRENQIKDSIEFAKSYMLKNKKLPSYDKKDKIALKVLTTIQMYAKDAWRRGTLNKEFAKWVENFKKSYPQKKNNSFHEAIKIVKKILIKLKRMPNQRNKGEESYAYSTIVNYAYGRKKRDKNFAKWVEDFKKKCK